MQRFCHNCGDPVEEGEIFCDKCGTKILTDDQVQEAFQTNKNPGYSDVFINKNNQTYQTNADTSSKKPSKSLKFARMLTKISIIGTVIIIILIIIGTLLPDPVEPTDKPTNTPTVNTGTNNNNNSNNTSNNNNTNNNNSSNNTTKPAADIPLVTWTANLSSNATFAEAEKKISVDYSVVLKNEGTGGASNVKVYLDPVPNDDNATYLSITSKTIVNLYEDIPQINSGVTKDVRTKFYYSNVDASLVSQAYLQDIANRYIRIPVLVEWQENGKVYTQSLLVK